MPAKGGNQELIPTFRVSIAGQDLAKLNAQAAADLFMVSVYEDVTAPNMFTLTLNNEDMRLPQVTWSDKKLFAEGTRVEIEMGYGNDRKKLIVGDITGLEPAFRAGEPSRLTVRGYDLSHRLLRGRKTRSFAGLTDMDIAAKIADGASLQFSGGKKGVRHDYVLQENKTDWAFLQERARRNGYVVMIEGNKLVFGPPQLSGSDMLRLALDDLLEFYPRTSTLNQTAQVTVRGWHSLDGSFDQATILGKAGAGDETTALGAETGPTLAKSVFGQSATISVRNPVSNKPEGDQLAQSVLDEMALAYVTGEGSCRGKADLRAGRTVLIEGLGERFSGKYYVRSATHTYSPSRGYRTSFTVRRNAT